MHHVAIMGPSFSASYVLISSLACNDPLWFCLNLKSSDAPIEKSAVLRQNTKEPPQQNERDTSD